MNNFFTSLYPVINLHKKMSIKAEIVTQMIYGESFSILKSNNKWLKIKILEDKHPLGFGGYVDVLNGVKFLIDGNSKWITGTNLVIDGGYLL